jgi:hypothetical protein
MTNATSLKKKYAEIKALDYEQKTPGLFVSCCRELSQNINDLLYTRGEGQELGNLLEGAFWMDAPSDLTVTRATGLLWEMAEWAPDEDGYSAGMYESDKKDFEALMNRVQATGWLPTAQFLRATYAARMKGKVTRSRMFTWYPEGGAIKLMAKEHAPSTIQTMTGSLEEIEKKLPQTVNSMELIDSRISLALEEFLIG